MSSPIYDQAFTSMGMKPFFIVRRSFDRFLKLVADGKTSWSVDAARTNSEGYVAVWLSAATERRLREGGFTEPEDIQGGL